MRVVRRWMSWALWCLALLCPFAAAPANAEEYGKEPWRYGNWGGRGYSNGQNGGSADGSAVAVDLLDEVFKQHDKGYADADRKYEKSYKAAFEKAVRKILQGSRMLVPARTLKEKAQKDDAVGSEYKKWWNAYRAADDKAYRAASDLTKFPRGIDPSTKQKEKKGKVWEKFSGSMCPSEKQRAEKRSQFLIALGASLTLNGLTRPFKEVPLSLFAAPPRERSEEEVLAICLAAR